MNQSILSSLVLNFARLSFIAVGGANTIVPEIHRFVVDDGRLMTAREFADLYALAQAAPGPNVLVVALVGFKVAGTAGALAALSALCLPTCVLAYFAGGFWARHRAHRVMAAIQYGMAPLTAGLVLASGFVIARGVGGTAAGVLGAAAALVLATTRVNPLWVLAAGALAGVLGWA